MDTLFRDVRYGFRSLLKRPGFTIIAVLTLALGIGANTAIFTLVNAVLLKSLPVTNPEQLVLFGDKSSEGTSLGDSPSGEWTLFSYESYQSLRNHNESFADLCAFRSGENRLSVSYPGSVTGGAAQRAQGHLVSGNYFPVLGVTAMKGRVLTPADDAPNAAPAAVISNRYWELQFNRDAEIVGKNVNINGTIFTVVGVTPPEFFGERVRRSPDFWLPLSFQPQIELRESYLENKEAYWLTLMGRLKPGVSLEQAQSATNLALRQFMTEQAGNELTAEVQKRIQSSYVNLVSGAQGISGLRYFYSRPLHMSMAIVGMVLLIACANVGGLFLARAAAIKSEISLRLALGASRMHIVRQLLTESLLLAVIGGAGGVLLAIWGVSLLVNLVAKEAPLDTRPDLLVLSFTAAVSLLSGLLFGLAPAIRASRTDLSSAMKEKTRTGRRGSRLSMSSAMVVTQVCLSMVLLTGAGLFARSLLKLQREDLGFQRENVLLVGIDPRLAGYKPAELKSLYERLLERLKNMPSVSSATISSYSPMSGTARSSNVTVPGYQPQPDEKQIVDDLLAGPNYCDTLGIPVLQGRQFDQRDTPSSLKVALINQAFAEHYFANRNPVGQKFKFGDDEDPGEMLEIVGVIGNIKSADAREKPVETAYRPILQAQDEYAYSATVQIRTHGDANSLAPTVRQAINQLDERIPIYGVKTLREQLDSTLRQDVLIAELVSFFGLLAVVLACVGLYGVMANGVVRRTNEIGIRMALGAERRNIIWMVLRETLLLVAVGLAFGIPAALASGRLVSSQLFGLKASDPLTLVGAALVLTSVAVLAGYVPARKASRVDPLRALRYELLEVRSVVCCVALCHWPEVSTVRGSVGSTLR